MCAAKLEYKDLTSYIISLPKIIIEKIFDHPTTCLAIFRELPELAKTFVMRLLLINQEVPQATVSSWVNSLHGSKCQEATSVLTNLGIWHEVRAQGGMPAWGLKPSFKANLYSAVFGEAASSTGLVQVNDQGGQQADSDFIEKLDKYAIDRWESVLKYIVNPRDSKGTISLSTKEILKHADLMKSISGHESDSESVVLTASAFQFLLWNRRLQIWYFIIQLLEYSQKNNQDISECLMLLFELSFSTFGKPYSCENFTPVKEFFLQELRTIGLVYMKTRKEKRFYPTRFTIQLANGLSEEDEQSVLSHDNGFIVVETNYRVYAYTNSQLQISLLALFTELMYKFPNMVVGLITRDSIREAFQMGITAHQIVSFLRTNAHPQMCARKPVLPVVVVDQINMWQAEKNRFKFTDGVFYGQFNTSRDFEMLKKYAKDLGALVWSNDAKRNMFVKASAHDAIRKYYKLNKPKD